MVMIMVLFVRLDFMLYKECVEHQCVPHVLLYNSRCCDTLFSSILARRKEKLSLYVLCCCPTAAALYCCCSLRRKNQPQQAFLIYADARKSASTSLPAVHGNFQRRTEETRH